MPRHRVRREPQEGKQRQKEMEYYNKILCVTFAELTGGRDPVMKANTLKCNVQRSNIACARRGGGEGTQALYVWSSIPEKYRRRFVATYGDPEEKMREAMTKASIKIDAKAREYYEAYTYMDKDGQERHLTEKMIEEYTINASVLGELEKMAARRQAIRSSLNAPMSGAWDLILDSSERMRESYGHTLPGTLARLKTRLKAWKSDGYQSVVSGKLGNTSALKITGDFLKLIVALKRSKVPVYTDAQLFEKANEIAEERGWKPIRSLSGMKKWLNSPSVEPLWYDAVYGEQAARQRYGRKHKTALPTRRDTLWYGDGTKLNLYYRDEQGKVRTTQVYEVIDAMSEVLLGYCISDTEDYEAQYHAYRMAIQKSGHKPYEIVYDNQGGHKKLDSDGFIGKICRVHRPTQPYNGESKTIESVFGRFQAQVLHKDWRFTGQNVTAKKASSRPNVEFIEANKDSLYTLEELKDAYAAARKEWNEGVHPATGERRIDMYEKSVNEETQEVTLHDMVDMFWVFTKRMATFTDQGLQVTIKGEKRQYEVCSSPGVPDHEWRRKHTYERFIVAYDPYDFASIRLYTKGTDGSLRFERTAEPYILIHRALQDQQGTGDAKFIRQEQEANLQDRIERTVAGRTIAAEHGTDAEQQGLHSPKLKGTTAAVQRQIDHRMERYSQPPEQYQLGRHTKSLSLDDWLDVMEGGDDGDTPRIPLPMEKKIASKL